MARPKSKSELIDLSQKNFSKLFDYIEGLSPEEQNRDFPEGTMNRNISDVLAHVYHWHLMMLEWYQIGMTGKKPEMPAKGYSWKNTPALNQWIWEKYSKFELSKTKKLLTGSHQKILKIIENHSDDELFEKKRYKWTGTTSLGAYLVSSTSSHYDWALKLISRSKKG